MRRLWARFGLVAGAVTITSTILTLAGAGAASAHPLGNATVNHYDGITVLTRQVDVLSVEDVAEIPTLQRKPLIDANGDGQLEPAETAAYAAGRCRALAAAQQLTVANRLLRLHVVQSSYSQRPGAIHLPTGRLTCRLSAPVTVGSTSTFSYRDTWDAAGIGWHEITAVGSGVRLQRSPFPANSISNELRHYPNDLLSSPLDVTSGQFGVTAGSGASSYLSMRSLSGAGPFTRALNDVSNTFNNVVGARHLTVGVGLLAFALSFVLGAGHALLPGHGKTVMAAYLVGRRGRTRDVVTVGATVTITHTAGVLILGAVIGLSAAFAPTEVEQQLAILSGLIVAAVGVALLGGVWRRSTGKRHTAGLAHHHAHTAHHHVHTAHAHAHTDQVDDHAGHDHAGHDHAGERRFGRGGLLGLGVAGGLVPSPSALLVLLAAGAMGRTVFGVLLVITYGIGMAVTFSIAGLILVRVRSRIDFDRIAARHRRTQLLLGAMPALTAVLVLIVGVGLTIRAVHGGV